VFKACPRCGKTWQEWQLFECLGGCGRDLCLECLRYAPELRDPKRHNLRPGSHYADAVMAMHMPWVCLDCQPSAAGGE
jgi:hypothetical protein